MFSSFPPFPSPNPESVSEPLSKLSSTSPRSSISIDTMSSSFISTSSSIDSAVVSDPDGEPLDDSHPSVRSRRNSARKCVPPRTRLVKSKRSQTQSPPPTSLPSSSVDASTSSVDSLGSDDGHVHFVGESEGVLERTDSDSSGKSLKSSLRRHSHAYEDSLRIGGGAWHPSKKVTWAVNDDEI